MKADYLSFKRAASVSLLGMALQLAMGLALLIYGLITADRSAESGGLFILVGVPVWLVLAIVFDQARRERIEAIENEALFAGGVRESSAFAEGADDTRVAHKRLLWMHKFLVPAVSLGIVALLGALGYWRYTVGLPVLKNLDLKQADNAGWPIAIGLALAFTGFVFARYIAGMAKQPVWAPLKAGAAASVGAAIAGLAISVAHFVDFVGPNVALRWLHVIFPIAMFVIGAEVLLNFLLEIYRPRKAGEMPQPAFGSRLLGFAAAPDRIAESIGGALNYQFGFDVTGSWFYQLISRSMLALLGVGLFVMWAMTTLAVVHPNEQGIRVRLGRQVLDTPLAPGPYFKWPWPFETIETFKTTVAERINLGGEPPNLKAGRSILWTNEHGVAETYFAVQPTAAEKAVADDPEHADGRARDVALIAAEVPLIYAVKDFVKFDRLAAPDQRRDILRNIGRREVFRHMATTSVEQVLGESRPEISVALRKRIQARLDELDAGVEVLFVGIEGAHPPRETAVSFESVVQSGQRRQASVLAAQTQAERDLIEAAGSVEMARRIVTAIHEYESLGHGAPDDNAAAERRSAKEREIVDLLMQAGGKAARLVEEARADRWAKHMDRRGVAEQYAGQLAAYRAAPEPYIAQYYFQTLLNMMKDARVFIVSDDVPLHLSTNLEATDVGGNIFLTKPKDE